MIPKFAKKFVRKMTVCDVSLIKLSVLFATLFLITVWPAFQTLALSIEWHWYLIAFILVTLPVLKKMFLD